MGSIFDAYCVQCWHWEVVELARKLVLTGVLAAVSPGSATQVTIGCLIAFGMLMLFLRLRPYAVASMNTVGALAQVNLFMILYVALLLKVRVNGDATTDSRLFNGIIGLLALAPILLPVGLKLTVMSISAGGEEEGEDAEDLIDDAGELAGAEEE